jgi:hypothetical protein
MKKLFKARVIKTKKRVQVEELADGRYIDIVTGMIFTKLQIDIVKPRRTIWQTGFHFLRFGFFLHFRQFVHLNSWYLTPGLTFDFITAMTGISI